MNTLQFTAKAIVSALLIGGASIISSCSGDDGADGVTPECKEGTWHNGNKDTGVSCQSGQSVPPTCVNGTWHNGSTDTGTPCVGSGATPLCVDGTWHNGTVDTEIPCTANAENCVIENDGEYYVMKCGGVESARWAKAMCGTTAYDPSKQLCDFRDGKMYEFVTIGEQVWTAKNINYAPTGKCYANDQANCDKYGRLYNWETALTACPIGSHLPSKEEFEALMEFAEESAAKLKAKTGWNDYLVDGLAQSGNGTDDYGFAALPGGNDYNALGNFTGVGTIAYFWTADEAGSSGSICERINHDKDEITQAGCGTASILSVRCIKD